MIVSDRTLQVLEGLQGKPCVLVKADSRAWVKFLRKDVSLFRALTTGKIRIKGDPRLMGFFKRCFPV